MAFERRRKAKSTVTGMALVIERGKMNVQAERLVAEGVTGRVGRKPTRLGENERQEIGEGKEFRPMTQATQILRVGTRCGSEHVPVESEEDNDGDT